MRKISMLGVILIFIVASPMYLRVSSLSQLQPTLLKVTTSEETKTIEILGKKVLTLTITRIEEWTNGTKLQKTFYHFLNRTNSTDLLENLETLKELDLQKPEIINFKPPDIIVVCSKWIKPEEATEQIKSITSPFGSQDVNKKPLAGVYYVYYPYTCMIDGLQFVLKGEYNGVFVTYDHDDNYNIDGYYPLEANLPYTLTGNKKPYHIHLPKYLLDAWIAGNISEAQAKAWSMIIEECTEETLKLTLEEIAKRAGIAIGCPVLPLIAAILDWVMWFLDMLELLGYVSAAQWVKDVVVEQFLGDGWTWRGPIKTGTFIGHYWIPYRFIPMTGVCYYKFKEYNQTWGSEGIFNDNPDYMWVSWLYRIKWLPDYRPWGRHDLLPTHAVVDGAGKYFRTWP